MKNNDSLTNALTIDVEDYFQVSAFAPYIKRTAWDSIECRVEKNIDKIIKLLKEKNIKATFFTLGWIAERFPSMLKRILAEGHELASHGYGHARVNDLTKEEFYQDVSRAKGILEDIGGEKILGYRAPSFSIGIKNLWALEILLKTGHSYSSSIYPVKHDHYGSPSAPRFLYKSYKDLIEIPPTTVRFFERNIPASGGGYFRLCPYALSKWLLQHVNNQEKRSAVFYFHPWEIDADQPRIQGLDIKSKFRHYINIGMTEKKLNRLLQDFKWDRMDQVFIKSLN